MELTKAPELMWSILIITCSIFQSAIAYFLLNGVRRENDLDKQIRAMLIILLFHLSTKFLLLAVLKNDFLYSQVPTGFGLAYGPLLLVIARTTIGNPMRPRAIIIQFAPFVLFSLVYVSLIITGIFGGITISSILAYASWYQWLVIASLFCYPVYAKFLLRHQVTAETKLAAQMANVLLIGISAGLLLTVLHKTVFNIPEFDLRLLPYLCFSFIPVLILRHRLQKNEVKNAGEGSDAKSEPIMEEQSRELETAIPVVIEVQEQDIAPGKKKTAPIPADRRYEKSGMDAARMDEYEIALAAYMKKSRIYLDPDLSLEHLATQLKMPKHHLTQLLNERMMKNFYSYINDYRIGEAIARMNDTTQQVNILSLAFDCGFNSRSSFNQYFKKITGYTPSDYRKQRTKQIIPGI